MLPTIVVASSSILRLRTSRTVCTSLIVNFIMLTGPTFSLAGSGRKGFNRAVSATTTKTRPLHHESFGTVGLKYCAKYASLSTYKDRGASFVLCCLPLVDLLFLVACFDATDIFTGKHPKASFDTTSLGKNCPKYEREFVRGDLVAVFHSVNETTGKMDGEKRSSMDFGLYAVALLAHGSGM